MIRWFNEITGNYLIALLLFAIVVKLVMAPLAIKQQRNQIKQAKLRPMEMAIRRRYNGRNDEMVDGRSYSETYADHIVSRAKDPSRFVAIRKKLKE